MTNLLTSIKSRLKLFLQGTWLPVQDNGSHSLNKLLILQGRSLALANASLESIESIHQAEFKVFSQFGEDGIIQYLIREAKIEQSESVFIEFGVQDYTESNTRFLLQNNHWKGLIIDSSADNMDSVRNSELYWRYDLTAATAWVDCANINGLLTEYGFNEKIGILSIDIDGNDYWVWDAIDVISPVIVIVEWNSVFGPRHSVTVPYDPFFDRRKAHYSCLYWGASISAFEALGLSKGYSLVGSNIAGNNLFFVRNDRLGRLASLNASQAYMLPSFRDSRDISGTLDFITIAERYRTVENLPVVDTSASKLTTLLALDSLGS